MVVFESNLIEALPENNEKNTMRMIANILKIYQNKIITQILLS